MRNLLFTILMVSFPAVATAAEGATPCADCGSPQSYTIVGCELVALHFVQATEGSVAIRLYDADGAVIYDRYTKDRVFVKRVRDTYAICKSVVAKATKVTITRCIPEIATSKSYEGNVLKAFLESKKEPVRLP